MSDGRQVMVYDDGTERKNIIAVIKTDGKPKIITLKNTWDWENELVKILGISKEELGFK